MDIKIIIATHKKYEMPEDEMYLPLHVGREGKKDLGYTGDNTGDNISKKNPSYCELTGLYWAWKNLDVKYLGMAHYRRHFTVKKKSQKKQDDLMKAVLSEAELAPLLRKYRIIVPKKRRYYIESLYSHYAHTHYKEHLDAVREIILKSYPDYLEDYDTVVKQTSGYMFNMFIMEKELADHYCQWLFDILFQLEENLKEREYSFFQGRFYGRVSEIIFNVWLKHQGVTYMEIPYMYMEKIAWGRKIRAFLGAKLIGKKYEGSF